MLNTLRVISSFGKETYNFDVGFLNLLDQKNRTVTKYLNFSYFKNITNNSIILLLKNEFKQEALQILCDLTDVNEKSIQVALAELKRLQVELRFII